MHNSPNRPPDTQWTQENHVTWLIAIEMQIKNIVRYHITKARMVIIKRLRSLFIPISRKGNAEECSNYHTIAHISHARKVMLKILQCSKFSENFQMFKLDLEKAEEPEIKLLASDGSQKKHENSRKIFPLLPVWITTNSGKFLKRWEYQTT